MKLEKDLIKQISERLTIYKITGEVAWFSRLNSGKVKTYYGSYIKLCDENTPDFQALVNMRDDSLHALFIEGKSDSGTLRPGQMKFMSKYQNHPHITVMCIKDIDDLDKWINLYAVDTQKEMKEWNL